MSDREQLLSLLDSFGLEPKLEGQKVVLLAKEGGVGGYIGFACEFVFHPDGSFSEVGVWE